MAELYDPEKCRQPIRRGYRRWYDDRHELEAMTSRPDFWEDLAGRLAQDAYRAYFSVRWGTWWLARFRKVAIFNNNPYAGDPFRRDRELMAIRGWLDTLGIRELGCGFWPPPTHDPPRPSSAPGQGGSAMLELCPQLVIPGQRPYYSYAVVVDAPMHAMDTIRDLQEAAFMMDLD